MEDAQGDYTFGKNKQNFISGVLAVSQAIKTRLLLLKNEWWEDQEDGLALFQSILGQPGTPDKLNAADLLIQDRIINTLDVTGIESFLSTYENRQYSISCVVNTKYGNAKLEVTL